MGTYGLHEAILSIAKTFAANVARSVYPEPFIDRRGRLLGNVAAQKDLVTRRLPPMNALRMDGGKSGGASSAGSVLVNPPR